VELYPALARRPVEAKVFDPMDEQRVRQWLKEGPKKEIVGGSVYLARSGGLERQVGVVLYVEERTIDGSARE
jgi:hypothetical protein